MVTKDGPRVLEFNARFGDPEVESYMRLLKSDLYDIFNACIEGKINNLNIDWENKYACSIVLASRGYPETSEKGVVIKGIDEAEKEKDVLVFHVGTKCIENKFVTDGGRVLEVTAVGNT